MQRILAWAGAAARCLGGIVKSALTGPDGVSWAPGRIMAAATFIVAQCLVIRASQAFLPLAKTAMDFGYFFAGVAGFQAVTGATCIALVLGNAPADPGGGFWKASAPEKAGG